MAQKTSKKIRNKKPRLPKITKGWIKFLNAHPTPYTAIFMHRPVKLPTGVTLTKLVQSSLKALVTGRYVTLTQRASGASVVLVAFAVKADFDRVKAHHNGKPWKSIVVGSIDGFSVTLP